MRVVFMGTGAFAVPSLRALLEAGHEVAALVTQPDREKGRGQALAAPPTKLLAQERGLPVLQPRRVREPAVQDELRALRPELQVVVAFGQILPRTVIDLAPRGTVNVHASLLPRYRGAAPIQWAVASGETETGVSTMLIDEGLDTGPILLRRSLAIGTEETAGELEPRLAGAGRASSCSRPWTASPRGSLQATPQDPALATLARILRKEDGRLDCTRPARRSPGACAASRRGPDVHVPTTPPLEVLRASAMRPRRRPPPASVACGLPATACASPAATAAACCSSTCSPRAAARWPPAPGPRAARIQAGAQAGLIHAFPGARRGARVSWAACRSTAARWPRPLTMPQCRAARRARPRAVARARARHAAAPWLARPRPSRLVERPLERVPLPVSASRGHKQ